MKRWLAATPFEMTRPTITKNAPANGDSALISTPSKRTTDAIPMKLRCSFCQLIHVLAPRMTATSQAATSRIQLRRRLRSPSERPDRSRSRCTQPPTNVPIP